MVKPDDLKISKTTVQTVCFPGIKPFNLDFPVNQPIIFPEQNLSLKGSSFVNIRVSNVGEANSMDSTVHNKGVQHSLKDPKILLQSDFSWFRRGNRTPGIGAYIWSDLSIPSLLWVVWGLGPKPCRMWQSVSGKITHKDLKRQHNNALCVFVESNVKCKSLLSKMTCKMQC